MKLIRIFRRGPVSGIDDCQRQSHVQSHAGQGACPEVGLELRSLCPCDHRTDGESECHGESQHGAMRTLVWSDGASIQSLEAIQTQGVVVMVDSGASEVVRPFNQTWWGQIQEND